MKKSNYILAVDDRPDNLFLIQMALEEEGYEIVLANDGYDALAEIEDAPPALILLDVMMPEMDGYEVTRKIRNNPKLPFIPILLVTAHEESSVVKGLDEGADDFIRKPFQIDELQARVRALMRLKQSIDQRENFVRCLTHDLRTPLVAADRMFKLLQQGVFGEVPATMEEAISSMIVNNQNLLEMLNQLLAVYSYDVGRKTLSFIEFDLKSLLEEVISELTLLAKDKGLDLQLNISGVEQIKQFKGDRIELRRVVTNLIGNAIKFTDQGGIDVNLNASEATGITIEVKDTGIGISDEDQATLFEAFSQGKHKRSGNGLGLHLCRQIIEAHQGTISVQSQLEKGTTFTVSLPLKP